MSPISPNTQSPPTSPAGQSHNVDPFGQLSLNSIYNSGSASNDGVYGPSSSPKSPFPTNSYYGSNNTNPGMTNEFSSHQQPMVISPENTAGSIVPANQQHNQHHQNGFITSEADDQPPSNMGMSGQNLQNLSHPFAIKNQHQQNSFVSRQQQPFILDPLPANKEINNAYGHGMDGYYNNTNNSLSALSPPISPLYAPSSPQGGGNGMPENNEVKAAVKAAVAAVPPPNLSSLAPEPWNGASVPNLNPTAAANPFGDAFAIGGNASHQSATPPLSAATAVQSNAHDQNEVDFWADMGFGVSNTSSNINNAASSAPHSPSSTGSYSSHDNTSDTNDAPREHSEPIEVDSRGLPCGGDYYKARVVSDMLGAIFTSARELRSTLYSAASDQFVDSLGEHAVVSFTVDGSAADTAGICLGHVLLNVNGNEVRGTDDAVRLIGSSQRPLVMEFYIPPNLKVVKTEGQCMVKYDTQSTEAPASKVEWKPKYVVVGDMLGKPHILYMYRSKAEYDTAVKESQTPGRTLSVKVKQFDIRGARIFHERGQVKYPNQPLWHYFTVVRHSGLPIKISSTNPEELASIYDGIMGYLEKEARQKKAAYAERRERMAAMYRETYY